MMTDIVERLRKRKRAKGFEYSVDPVDGHDVLDTVYGPDPDCIEAADEIERLRAENEAGLRNTLAMQNAANVLRIRAEKAEAEIERLMEVLKIIRVAVENFGMTGGNDRFALGYVDELARETLEAKDE